MKRRVMYGVSTGSYSSYTVEAVFSTEAKAQEYIDECRKLGRYDDFNDIEEFEYNPRIPAKVRQGWRHWAINMDREGNILWADFGVPFNEDQMISNSFDLGVSWPPAKPMLCGRLMAKSQEHAIKVVNEQRAQLIASGEWDRFARRIQTPQEARA